MDVRYDIFLFFFFLNFMHSLERGCSNVQFFITCAKADWLDGKHVVFGKVLDEDSMLVVRKIENIPVGANSKPKLPVLIEQCGEL